VNQLDVRQVTVLALGRDDQMAHHPRIRVIGCAKAVSLVTFQICVSPSVASRGLLLQ